MYLCVCVCTCTAGISFPGTTIQGWCGVGNWAVSTLSCWHSSPAHDAVSLSIISKVSQNSCLDLLKKNSNPEMLCFLVFLGLCAHFIRKLTEIIFLLFLLHTFLLLITQCPLLVLFLVVFYEKTDIPITSEPADIFFLLCVWHMHEFPHMQCYVCICVEAEVNMESLLQSLSIESISVTSHWNRVFQLNLELGTQLLWSAALLLPPPPPPLSLPPLC